MADDDEYERLLAGHDACNGVCGGGEQDKPLCPDCVCPGPKGHRHKPGSQALLILLMREQQQARLN